MTAALFDLDGVLIDSEGIYSNFWSSHGRKYGISDPAFADKIKGTTLRQILDNNFPAELHQAIVADLVAFEDNMEYPIFPGAIQFLQQLKDANIPTAIVTSSGDKKMQRLWRQHPELRGYFDTIVTDSRVQRSKPDPQAYQIAAADLGCDPCDCFVFEDSYAGLLAGRRSGATVIALSTTNPADTLADKADMVVPSLADIDLDALLQLKK